MTRNSAIDLSRLPSPDIVETLDVEVIVSAAKSAVLAYAPELAAVLDLESEPVVKLIECFAMREVLLRARVNDAAKAVLLASAAGADLENLAAFYGVTRLEVTPADEEAVPPTPAVMETDTNLRRRAQLALEGFSTAGPRGAYEFHARSADGRVVDVLVDSPDPGAVRVVLLSSEGNGQASAGLISVVNDALNAEDVRPLCDTVLVQSAVIVPFAVNATLSVFDGPDPALVLAEAQAALTGYLAEVRGVGRAVRLSGLYMALHRPGVEAVTLASPLADVEIDPTEAAHCSSVNLTIAGSA